MPERMAGRRMRFATQSGGAATGPEWLATARRMEEIGYGTLAMPDHMAGNAWACLPALAAAAVATTRLRLGTLVIDNDFRNPVVFAREIAALDVISEGRLELGIGAGWFDRDYQGTGIPMDRGRVRVARLAEAVGLLKRLFAEDEVTFAGTYYRTQQAECRPRPVQRPHPPLLIAGGGPEILALAGAEADIVAILPPGAGARPATAEQVAIGGARTQIAQVHAAAGDRFARIELSIFLDVILTEDREAAIASLAEKGKTDPEIIRGSIYRGIGTLAEVRAHILRVREALGITYFCLRGPHVEALAPIVHELTGG